MQAFPDRIPVVIVGAGPTGLTAANLLASYGVKCIVLERESAPLDLPRAIVLDDEGARTLQAIGLKESYVDQTFEGQGARYYNEEGNCFATVGSGARSFGFAKRHFILQPELEKALRDRLEEQAPGALRFDADVTEIVQNEEHAIVSLCDHGGKTHQIRTDWVLACDGGRSSIRERLDIAMKGNTYTEDWIVVDTVNDPDSTTYAKFFCSSHRPTVSVPAPHGGRRYEFMVLPGETREAVLKDEFLAKLLEPYRSFSSSDILRKTVYTFHARIAERFREARVLLMGDAAHLTPPFAGQGMNAGLRDTHNVAWKIAAVMNGGATPDILDTYNDERRGPAWDMIQLAVAMGGIVMPVADDQVRFRDLLLTALEPFPAVRDYLIQMRFKPKPQYRTGLFLDLDNPMFEASLPGMMIPQPLVGTDNARCLLDYKLGAGFALIGQGREAASVLSNFGRCKLLGMPLTTLLLDPLANGLPGGLLTFDIEISRPFLTHRDQIILIRPDRYCAAACAPGDLNYMIERYEELFLKGSRTDPNNPSDVTNDHIGQVNASGDSFAK